MDGASALKALDAPVIELDQHRAARTLAEGLSGCYTFWLVLPSNQRRNPSGERRRALGLA